MKWNATVSCSWAPLSQSGSAASERISLTWRSGSNRAPIALECRAGSGRVAAGDEVLALQLGSPARGEPHPEVGQPLVPRADLAELGGQRLQLAPPRSMCVVTVAEVNVPPAPAVRRAGAGRDFSHTWVASGSTQSVKTLTL